MKFYSRIYFPLVMILAAILCFYRIGVRNVSEWDEAHNGINAFEMLKNGDYINLYFGGQPDTWNAKPPLLTWMIALSYKLVGFNETALRLPVAICCILFFAYFFKLVERFAGSTKALFTCLLLFSCKAILGWHMALNGDYDVPLLLFLTASIYHYVQFIDEGKSRGIYLAAIFTGLAFYTKGPAAFMCAPGLLLYTAFRGKAGFLFRNYRAWLSLLIFFMIAGSWVLLLTLYGKTFDNSFYGSKNNIETMFVYDTYQRMTSDNFEPWQKSDADHWYLFHALDATMNLWNYVFYLVAAVGLYTLWRNKKNALTFFSTLSGRLVLLAVCILLPYALLLTFAKTKHAWYIAPAFGFIAFITVEGIMYMSQRWSPFKWMIAALFAFTFLRHLHYLHTLPADMHTVLNKNNPVFQRHATVVATYIPQHMVLYFNWLNLNFSRTEDANEIIRNKNIPLIVEKEKLQALPQNNIQSLGCFDHFCMIMVPGS